MEILMGSWLEHTKIAKDFALVYPVGHPKRKEIEDAANLITDELQSLKERENRK